MDKVFGFFGGGITKEVSKTVTIGPTTSTTKTASGSDSDKKEPTSAPKPGK